ncbi:TlpA family protein disulfide reductase [Solitalea koreensis]|uniref:AhpC/TSA family protein n=1 Tax=Solitalea koreensis TaxID=543615 RepID=A0A521AFK7_9SPHI|nr:TlpA disulfide reductase family protein [Solitalea koreensis]SMO33548.1 AhpC/TSA family protein [Solitalea koreensis]
MKKYLALLAVLASTILNAQAGGITEIKGVSKKTKPGAVKLYKIVHGSMEEIASSTPNAGGAFKFSFQPEYDGFYVIGSGKASAQDFANVKYKLYVKGKDKINLELNDSTYVLTGKNTKENQVLEQWYKLTYNIEQKSIYRNRPLKTYVDFFSALDAAAIQAKSWTNGKATGNAEFDNLMKLTVNYDLAHMAMYFLRNSGTFPTKENYNAYLKGFNADQFMQNEDLLKFPYGQLLLKYLVMFKTYKPGLGMLPLDKEAVMTIPNDVLKGEYVLDYASTVNSYAKFVEISDKYSTYFLTADQQKRAHEIAAGLIRLEPGKKAINFTSSDVTGKPVSLADFNGKIVYVHVWTMNGQIKENPLAQLEEEFQGKDVVFLSVFAGEEKDKENWKKFLDRYQWGGIQLFADPQIQKVYRITGNNTLSSFMLFDKNGNIINLAAPRPNGPTGPGKAQIKAVLNEWLSKS